MASRVYPEVGSETRDARPLDDALTRAVSEEAGRPQLPNTCVVGALTLFVGTIAGALRAVADSRSSSTPRSSVTSRGARGASSRVGVRPVGRTRRGGHRPPIVTAKASREPYRHHAVRYDRPFPTMPVGRKEQISR